MTEYRSVARVSEIGPGQLKQIELDNDKKICLANINGAFYAIGGECTHEGGPLAEGELDGTIVTCPWHGAMFDLTSGEVQGPPADDSEAKYEVRVQGDLDCAHIQHASGRLLAPPGRSRPIGGRELPRL